MEAYWTTGAVMSGVGIKLRHFLMSDTAETAKTIDVTESVQRAV